MNKELLRTFVHLMKTLGVEHGGLIRSMEYLENLTPADKEWADDYYLGRVA